MPEERLYFDLEIEFEALTTAKEVASNAAADQTGKSIADALFHELKLKFAGQDVHVGPPQGSFRRGSLVGAILQSLSVGGGAVFAMITTIETPGLVRSLVEAAVSKHFGRDVPLARFRHRLSVRRGWAHPDQTAEQAPLTVRWFRRRPLQMLSISAAVFVLASLAAFYFAQQDDARMLAISNALVRIEAKVDRVQSDSAGLQTDSERSTTPMSNDEAFAGSAPVAPPATRHRPTDVCRRISQEDASYLILRCR